MLLRSYYFGVIIRKIKRTINLRTRCIIGRKENEENLRVLLEMSLKMISTLACVLCGCWRGSVECEAPLLAH